MYVTMDGRKPNQELELFMFEFLIETSCSNCKCNGPFRRNTDSAFSFSRFGIVRCCHSKSFVLVFLPSTGISLRVYPVVENGSNH